VNDQVYTYDKVGNRKTFESPAGANRLYYNYTEGNRLADVRTEGFDGTIVHQYVYDSNGSRIEKKNGLTVLQSYTYDQKRRVIQVATGGVIDTFAYDPADYRIQKVEAAGTKNYLLEAEHLEATYDQNNQLTERFLRGAVIDEVVYGYRKEGAASVPATYHHDHLQSVIGLTGHDGASQQTLKYDPFGRVQSQSGSTSNDLSYTGRERDRDAGLYYYRARYYDPETGRFLTEDPKGFDAGANFYAYVNNNPLSVNDPMGLEPYGFSTGGSFNFFGFRFGYESFIMFDWVTFDLAYIAQSEFGMGGAFGLEGAEYFSADLSWSWNWSDPGASVFSYENSGMSGGGSFNAPLWGLTGTSGWPLGTENPPGLYSVGVTMGTPGVDFNLSLTDGDVYNTSAIRDGANWLIDGVNSVLFEFSDLLRITGGFDHIPAVDPASMSTSSMDGAGGGYVLYPGRPNYNMSTAVYDKGG
jgi:RHS repeat-associated protein